MNEGAKIANDDIFRRQLLGLLRDILEEVRIIDSRLLVIEERAIKANESEAVAS